MFSIIAYAFCVAINRIKLIPCSDTCLIQSEELLVIRANRKQARKSFQEGRPDSIIFVMFPLLYLFREFSSVYTMYRQRHIRAGYIPDCERLFRPEIINMQRRWNFLNRAATAISCAFKVAPKRRDVSRCNSAYMIAP